MAFRLRGVPSDGAVRQPERLPLRFPIAAAEPTATPASPSPTKDPAWSRDSKKIRSQDSAQRAFVEHMVQALPAYVGSLPRRPRSRKHFPDLHVSDLLTEVATEDRGCLFAPHWRTKIGCRSARISSSKAARDRNRDATAASKGRMKSIERAYGEANNSHHLKQIGVSDRHRTTTISDDR